MEMLIWIVGGVFLLASVMLLFYQRRIGRGLASELEQLGKVTKHNVEYELVLKAMKLCTWHIDVAARTITYDMDYRDANDSFVPLPGTSLDELVAAMADNDQQRIQKSLEDICNGRSDEYHEISRVHSKDGGYYWNEAYATVATRDTEGSPKAEESDRLKSAFIANMSHEIRTPLNAIIGFTSVLPDVQEEAERKELINLIQENNHKLLRIIDDVMNISKIESGKEQLVMSTFELNDILRSVAETYQPNAVEGVTISTMFALGTLNITTDLNRLMEVLNHLMSNATKFTSQGSVILGYDAPADKRVRIWVRDTGKGIAPEHQERVFERFFKVDEYIPGAGLGLSICRTMAYSMGGNVGVESTLGEGSIFWIEIPV